MEKTVFLVGSFTVLESQLAECMAFIPFIPGNEAVYSPKFVPIITDACSLIDSVFREVSTDDTERYNLKKYCDLFEPIMHLEDNTSLFLGSPLRQLQPFRGWTTAQPAWWAAYNSLKHDRLNNYPAATFRNAVLSLAGLHQVMSRCKLFIGAFLRAGWINTDNEDVTMRLAEIVGLTSLHPGPPDLLIESQLFVSPTRENFIDLTSGDSDAPDYFNVDYEHVGLSTRVRNLLFAHEDW